MTKDQLHALLKQHYPEAADETHEIILEAMFPPATKLPIIRTNEGQFVEVDLAGTKVMMTLMDARSAGFL